MIRTWYYNQCSPGSVPGLGNEIPHQAAVCHRRGKKKKSFGKDTVCSGVQPQPFSSTDSPTHLSPRYLLSHSSTHPSIYPPIHPSSPSIYPPIHPPTHLPTYPSICGRINENSPTYKCPSQESQRKLFGLQPGKMGTESFSANPCSLQ